MMPPDDETYGIVYFIGHGVAGPIKIGFTANLNPVRRLRELQTGTPEPLEVLGTVLAYASIERKIQQFLSVHAVRGEWYEREPALAVLERLKDSSTYRKGGLVEQLMSVVITDPRQCDDEADEKPLHVRVAHDLVWDIIHQLCRVNTSKTLPFRAWLISQRGRKHPTGDLAEDAMHDAAFPALGTLSDYLTYISNRTHQPAVTRATVEAWIECDEAVASLATREQDVWDWEKQN